MDDNTLLILFAFLALLFLSSNGNLTKSICGNLIEGDIASPQDTCKHIRKSHHDCNSHHNCYNLSSPNDHHRFCHEGKCSLVSTGASLDWASNSEDNFDTFSQMHENFNEISNNNDPNNFIRCQYGGGDHDSNYTSSGTNSNGRDYLSGYSSIKTNQNLPHKVRRMANRILCNIGHRGCNTGH